jgi:hypothetical protein
VLRIRSSATGLLIFGVPCIYSFAIEARVSAQSLDQIYKLQQQKTSDRYAKNLKYCTALFDKANYREYRKASDENREARFYIQNGLLFSIYRNQPSPDGSSCQRPWQQGVVMGKKYVSHIRSQRLRFSGELKKQGLDPSDIVTSWEKQYLEENQCIVTYSRNLSTGQVSREPLAILMSRPSSSTSPAALTWPCSMN